MMPNKKFDQVSTICMHSQAGWKTCSDTTVIFQIGKFIIYEFFLV